MQNLSKAEAQLALDWLAFCELWTELGNAAEIKMNLDAYTAQWNSIRKCFSCKGRPKGSKNKPKT